LLSTTKLEAYVAVCVHGMHTARREGTLAGIYVRCEPQSKTFGIPNSTGPHEPVVVERVLGAPPT
jgi:hypothetical protein